MNDFFIRGDGIPSFSWDGNFSEICIPIDRLQEKLPPKFQPGMFYSIKIHPRTSGPRWRQRKKGFRLMRTIEELEIFREEILPRSPKDGWTCISI